MKNLELAIRQEFAPVSVEQLDGGTVRVWVSMNTTSEEIESVCTSAGLAPHHVNLATALWNNNHFDRDFFTEGDAGSTPEGGLNYVVVRAPQEP